MERRRLLAAVGIGLTTPLVGCLDGGDGGTDDDGGTGDDGTDDGETDDGGTGGNGADDGGTDDGSTDGNGGDDGSAGVEVVGVTGDPAPDLPVEPTVAVDAGAGTADGPARIAIRWENVGDAAVRLGEARSVVFTNARSEDERAHLLGTDRLGDLEKAVAFDGCWRVTEGIAMDGQYDTVRLEPGEVHRGRPALYARGDGCLDGGSYRFETTIGVGDPDGSSGPDATEAWGLAVDVRGD